MASFSNRENTRAKNSQIDAQVIRRHAEMAQPKPLAPIRDSVYLLDTLMKRRDQLARQGAMEKQHLEGRMTLGLSGQFKSLPTRASDKEIGRIEGKLKNMPAIDPTLV